MRDHEGGLAGRRTAVPRAPQAAAGPVAGPVAQDAASHDFSAVAPARPAARFVQVGSASDPAEGHADRMAEGLGAAAHGPGASGVPAPSTVRIDEGVLSGGRPLDPGARSVFERRFGRDLAAVRIHTGTAAAASAAHLRARAYTLGSDLVFGAGEYAPQSAEGEWLLAHELAHAAEESDAGEPVVRRKPWGERPPEDKRRGASNKLVSESAELYAIAAYRLQNPTHTLMTNKMLAMGEVPHGRTFEERQIIDVIMREFHHGLTVKRRTISSTNQVSGRAEAARTALAGGVDFVKAMQEPDIVDVTAHEVYDVTTARQRVDKVKKFASRYTPLLSAITSRTFDPGTRMRPIVPPTLKLPKLGTITYAATDFERWPGVIQYDVIKPDDEKDEKKKKGKKKDSGKSKKKGAGKAKPKESPPKAQKPGKAPATPGGNFGLGLGILSTGGGKGNAGLGVAINSHGVSIGTVSAGIVYDSTGEAVGAVSVGASSKSSSTSALSAGAGTSSGSDSMGLATAGAGSSKDSSVVAMATAGTGESTNADEIVVAKTGSGASVPGGGATGTHGKGASGEGPSAEVSAAQGSTAQGSTAQGSATQGSTGRGAGTAAGLTVPGTTTDVQAQAVVAEAARIDAALQRATPAQRDLLADIVGRTDDQEFPVRDAAWVSGFLEATAGLSTADLDYLKTQRWVPTPTFDAARLRAQIQERLRVRAAAKTGAPPAPAGPGGASAPKGAKAGADQDGSGEDPGNGPEKGKDAAASLDALPAAKGAKTTPAGEPEPQDKAIERLRERARAFSDPLPNEGGVLEWGSDRPPLGPANAVLYYRFAIDGKHVTVTADLSGVVREGAKGREFQVLSSSLVVAADGRAWPRQAVVGKVFKLGR